MGYGVGDVEHLLKTYLEIVQELLGEKLVSVAVFGSAARGEAESESDIDILVVAKDLPVDIGSRMKAMASVRKKLRNSKAYAEAASKKLPRLFSEVILTPDEVAKHPPILLDVSVEGVLLFDKGGFLEKELENLRKRLRELGAKRVRGKEGWYWILKPSAKFGEVIEV